MLFPQFPVRFADMIFSSGGTTGLEDETRKSLIFAAEMIQTGKFKREDFLDSVWSLDRIGEAHEHMESNKAVGKVVLAI